MYEHNAICTDVIDADTIRAHVDLGFSVWRDEKRLRLAGINAAEMHARDPAQRELAHRARERVLQLLPLGGLFTVRTDKDLREKFGGYLAHVTLADGTDLNALLLREGLAVSYDGGKR
jgi:micrococcal nuclease